MFRLTTKNTNEMPITNAQNNDNNTQEQVDEPNHFTTIATDLITKTYIQKQKPDIWGNSEWADISRLENDDVGRVGESIINTWCKEVGIVSDIDGTKTKQVGGGCGDGTIKGETCEIKTARLGSSGTSFQHELGEVPWKAKYMVFLDIAPTKMYVTIFPNFSEDFYKKSGVDNIKCAPYFPTKSITWRHHRGAFKLDTSIKINDANNNTITLGPPGSSNFKSFVNRIIK